jgi:exosortase C (VPDSG-CTERM-specific)
LYDLARFAIQSDLYSHIILLPFIGLYLVWLKRHELAIWSTPSRKIAIIPVFLGVGILAGFYAFEHVNWLPHAGDLASMTLAFLMLFWGGCFFFFGLATLRVVNFPLLFLLFIVPFPESLQQQLQTFLQVGSAAAAHLFFLISSTPVIQQGTAFQLPGFSFEVAPECSGIHSSLVLFMTGLVAAHLLLRNFWAKALLVLFVVPLAIIRNGIRIFIIGQLCVHVGPDMIHSYIHRRGGPIFFAASLIPFFLLLFFLMKIESNKHRSSVRQPA